MRLRCADKFNPVAERIVAKKTPAAINVIFINDFITCRLNPRTQLFKLISAQSNMRFLGRMKVLINAQMKLHIAGLKPASAA